MRRIVRSTQRIGQSNSAPKEPTVLRQPKIAAVTPHMVEQKLFPWRPILRILLAAAVTAGVVWLLNSPIFMVRTVTVEGTKNVDKDLIIKQINTHSNLWLFPVASTEKKIKKASPLIADVAIYRGVPDALKVVIAERVMAVHWQSDGHDYVLGLDGKVIDQMTPSSGMPKVVDETNIQPSSGNTVVTAGFIQFVINTQQIFSKIIGKDIDHFEVGNTTFDLTVVPKDGPKLILDTIRNPDVQLSAGKLVLDQDKDKIKQYLDLRVPGKAYYQ